VARIIIESGPLRGKAVELPLEGELDVGRETGCSIEVKDVRVSRRHFSLSGDGKGYLLTDRESRNGTYVNGKRVFRTALRGGDLIRVGETFLSFSTEPEDPLIGETIGGHRIEKRIGRGGMGTVYRALQLNLDRKVAIKILSPALLEDREFVMRFLDEARAAGKLNHPNVVQVYNVGQEQNHFFLVMEYMAGGSLQELLDRRGPLPPGEALPMILDAAKALIWAGEKSIVHRDIKPDNLLLNEQSTVKIGDFGLAADGRKSKTIFDGGRVMGTPGYMAPEQALGKPVDARADLYALGSTLYVLLSGQPPFDGETPLEILLKKVQEPPKPLARAAPDVPRGVVKVVEKLMARDPGDRYSSAAEAYRALAAALSACRPPGHNGNGGRPGRPSLLSRAIRKTLGRLSRRTRD
jgi:serine/threonine protein kinase